MNIIHMLESFSFRNHICMTFELLSINLYELIKKNKFQGFSLQVSCRGVPVLFPACTTVLHVLAEKPVTQSHVLYNSQLGPNYCLLMKVIVVISVNCRKLKCLSRRQTPAVAYGFCPKCSYWYLSN